MIIAIVGSREFPKLSWVDNYIHTHFGEDDLLVSGGAKGVDQRAELVADESGIRKLIIPADWETFGKSAGFKRNVFIVSNADKVVAFWDGQSKGTKHTIDLTLKVGKCLEVITQKAWWL